MSKDDKFYQEIVDDLQDRIGRQPDSRAASPDEVRMAWLICMIEGLRKQINEAKNCLVCVAIADPVEICENTLAILEGKD